ncbi:uncharacterized protein LOC126668322 [Mercurialis annua]|uniref:uncharacterized protein LOC126668322 n=1 Tax=Mercurialis annua TaxID=3986 RepID=UPI00215E699D|nr:uncharacterized protein LOC126668322 [Mercurialis annua]
MALVLRYVDKRGFVVERFIDLTHVSYTSAASLKDAIGSMLSEHKLSLSRIQGQGYDGASNMRGEFNGLKSLIMRETGSAYYVHCFSHQLQLALIFVAKNHFTINDIFDLIARLLNVVGASCKRRDKLSEQQANTVIYLLINGELQTGGGLNQEMSIKRPGDTRWGSHYASLLNIMAMFSSIIYVLEDVERDDTYQDQKAEARRLLEILESFDFIFCLSAKERLQQMRDSGWEDLMNNVFSFCDKVKITIPKMEDAYVTGGRRRTSHVSNLHHYQVDVFYAVIDMQLQELNRHFDEVNSKLLLCVACLSPKDSFSAFDKKNLIKMA